MSGAFDILNETFDRVLILSVRFILLAPYPISVKKFAHTPYKLFLGIIGPYIDGDSTLAESVLKDLGNVKS